MSMVNQIFTADVLVVGGGTGGTAAAIQAARQGVQTIVVSESTWLGGMLTSAGVAAPDGNELAAFQTGLWGAFLRELRHRQTSGLDNSWVSMFSYDPRIGSKLLADWVKALPNLMWLTGQTPLEVLQEGDCITGVRFADFIVKAKVTLDATELGDLLALAEVPHRWGWELQSEFEEPSAPVSTNELTRRYPVQAPTWVVLLKDFGISRDAPEIPAPPHDAPEQFTGAWESYGAEQFLNYGRLPGGLFMINWPLQGNDYGKDVGRLVESPASQQQFLQEARWHTQSFARFIQTQLGCRYGLADNVFPRSLLGGGAYAVYPYYRESRRLQGVVTVREQDILPVAGGRVAPLPVDIVGRESGVSQGDAVASIALGNYANDHHYPGVNFPLQPKSIRWGGRWTGTPFTIPYGCLVPVSTEGLLVCEKNISVSHIANGATRLQPVVMNIGQAAGMAAALCVEMKCQPRDLPVRRIQEALLQDSVAPAAIIPLFNLPVNYPDWLYWQHHYLDSPENYPLAGNVRELNVERSEGWNFGRLDAQGNLAQVEGSTKLQVRHAGPNSPQRSSSALHRSRIKILLPYYLPPTTYHLLPTTYHLPPIFRLDSWKAGMSKDNLQFSNFSGIFQRRAEQDYTIILTEPFSQANYTWMLITLQPEVNKQLQNYPDQQLIEVWGRLNRSGRWLVVEKICSD